MAAAVRQLAESGRPLVSWFQWRDRPRRRENFLLNPRPLFGERHQRRGRSGAGPLGGDFLAEFVAHPLYELDEDAGGALCFARPLKGGAHLNPEIVGIENQLNHQPVQQRRHVFFVDRGHGCFKSRAQPRQLTVLVDEGIDQCLVLQAHGR